MPALEGLAGLTYLLRPARVESESLELALTAVRRLPGPLSPAQVMSAVRKRPSCRKAMVCSIAAG
jgi:hypothetical protein